MEVHQKGRNYLVDVPIWNNSWIESQELLSEILNGEKSVFHHSNVMKVSIIKVLERSLGADIFISEENIPTAKNNLFILHTLVEWNLLFGFIKGRPKPILNLSTWQKFKYSKIGLKQNNFADYQ